MCSVSWVWTQNQAFRISNWSTGNSHKEGVLQEHSTKASAIRPWMSLTIVEGPAY